jgi:DNA-binding NtrC family response regulator
MRFAALGELGRFEDGVTAEETPSSTDLVDEILAQGLSLAASRKLVVEAFERRYIERALEQHGGVVTEAAKAAGIARRHFYRVGKPKR